MSDPPGWRSKDPHDWHDHAVRSEPRRDARGAVGGRPLPSRRRGRAILPRPHSTRLTYPAQVWWRCFAPLMFDDMTTVVDALPFVSGPRLRAGDTFIARELVTLAGRTVR